MRRRCTLPVPARNWAAARPADPASSPHALVQEFLNRTEHLWGIVTNGLVLRVLRKSPAVRRQAYLEFDLQTLFEADRF